MQNIDLTGFKAVVEPKLVAVMQEILNPQIILSVARGMGYKEKIKELTTKQEPQLIEKIQEDGSKTHETVMVGSVIEEEIDNPKTPFCYMADKLIDILFQEFVQAIKRDYEQHIIPEEIGSLLKHFENEAEK